MTLCWYVTSAFCCASCISQSDSVVSRGIACEVQLGKAYLEVFLPAFYQYVYNAK